MSQGHDVRVLLRPGSDRRNLKGQSIEVVEGDLRDQDSLQAALSSCDYLFHVAADYRLWIPDPKVMYEINVQGTRRLMQLARQADINKIVYTSSVATLGIHSDRTPANEESPVSIENMVGHYKRSKYLAEGEVKKMVKESGLPAVIVNPSTPIGPGDVKPTPTGRIIVDCINRKIPAYVDTGLNIVHVDDVALGHLLALEKGSIGERYVLGGEDMSLKDILVCICEMTSQKPPRLSIPHNVVLPMAWICERWASLTGVQPIATVDAIKMAKKHMFFSSQKAKEKLGYQSRPAREAISDAIEWFLEQNYCQLNKSSS